MSARAVPSKSTNRHGVSLPWSGTRTAMSRISEICVGLGPGRPKALTDPDFLVLRKFSGEEKSFSFVMIPAMWRLKPKNAMISIDRSSLTKN
jgi:hypothetical protein